MRTFLTVIFVFCATVFRINALNCRHDGGPKEEDLKAIYMNCLKKQDGRHSNDSRGKHEDRRRPNQFGRKDDRDEWGQMDHSGMSRDGMTSRYDWGERDKIKSRYDGMGSSDRMNRNGADKMNKDDFMEHDAFGEFQEDMPKQSYRSTPPPRRFKREKTSGHRSQYNPNSSRRPQGSGSDHSYREDESGSKENMTNKDMESKACALHCFLQELDMTDDNAMPDRHMVTQVITKDVRNEDLREFLQESVEECFQILHNENNHDKCEFSKNLMMCLSEKGRANCDDWKDDMKF